MRRTLSGFLPHSAFSIGPSEGVSGVQQGAHEGMGVRHEPPPDAARFVQAVDALLAGSAFDAEEVFNNYWGGHWKPDDARASLFGALKGAALRAAVQQVIAVGQQKLSQQRVQLREFNNLFLPMLGEAITEAESTPVVPEGPPSVVTASPSMPQALDVRRVINALYNRGEGDELAQVLDCFGDRDGKALLAALDEVSAGLNDTELNLDDENRERVRADIDTIRRYVLQAEADPERGEGVSIPPSPVSAAPLSAKQARSVVHALLDHEGGTDLGEVWALLEGLQGLDRLRALDQVERALNEDPLKDMIDETHRHRVGTCVEAMRQSVELTAEDGSMAALLRGAHPGGLQDSTPLDPWKLIGRLRKGKYGESDNAAVIDLFDGRTGSDLWDALDSVERVLLEDASSGERTRLPEDERAQVLACLESFRQSLLREKAQLDTTIDELIATIEQWDMPGDVPQASASASSTPPPADALGTLGHFIDQVEASKRLQPRKLKKDQPLFDLRIEAFRRALALGGMEALRRLLAHLNPSQQWLVLSTLVADPALLDRHPDLLALELDVYRHRMALRRDRPLECVLHWYRRLSAQTGAPLALPAVPAGIAAEEWVHELWILLYQLHPEPSRQRTELGRALERYQRALGVKTDREHAEALWLDSVVAALMGSDSGHSLLEKLCHRLGLDANVALALLAALAEAGAFDDDQNALIRRAAAILMIKHGHSLLCIALPYHKARTPQQLNIIFPVEPKQGASAEVLGHHQKLVDRWRAHAPLVDQDIHAVEDALRALPTTRKGGDGQDIPLTPGEQCDQLLCQVGLPPKRVEMALVKIVQCCTGPDDRDKYLLARRLLSELIYSGRNEVSDMQAMDLLDILQRLLGVVLNGVREGVAHGVAMYLVRLLAHYLGGWGFVVLGTVCVGLSYWARHHLDHAKSPDYELNPSPILSRLIEVVPPLNTLCLSGLMLGTGLLPVTNGLSLPFDIGEPLYLMNIMRALRQVMQSGTQPLARLFRLTDARGAGLPAQLTFFVNCGRDALYMASSIGFLFFMGRQLDEMVNQWGPPRSFLELLLLLAIKTAPSALNEFFDGMNPDIANMLARLLSWIKGALELGDDDFLLQPSVPLPLSAVPAHMADHIAGRSDIVGLQDPFNAASTLATHLGQPELALFFKWVAVVLNGFLGALRGRELNYLRTTDPVASAMRPPGSANRQNPDGLLVALAYALSTVAAKVQGAAVQLGALQAPPLQVATQMPPQVRQTTRQRVQALLQSTSRDRDSVPGSPRTNTDAASRSDEDEVEVDADPLVDLEITPRSSGNTLPRPPDDSRES